jgi:long-chain acyl-CoA synthetase
MKVNFMLRPQHDIEEDLYSFPGNLSALLDRARDLYPKRNGIGVPGQFFTFEEFYDRVGRIVHALRKIGLEREDPVLFISPNSLNFAFISLAIFRIGAVLVPLNPRIGHYELAHILSETNPKCVICKGKNLTTLLKAYREIQKDPPHCIVTTDKKAPSTMFLEELDLSRSTGHLEIMEPDDVAMIVYTAAMEGYALGAKLTHGSLFYDAACFASEAFRKEESGSEAVMSLLPLFHCYGFTNGFLVPLAGGVNCLLLGTSLGGSKIVNIMEAYQATQIISVPAIFFSIMKPLSEKPELCSRLRNLTSGGVAIPIKLLEKYWNRLGLYISEGYGLTETSPVITWNRIDRPPKFGTVGYPMACSEVKVIDDNGKDVPPGKEGEVMVRGLNLFSGYLDQPEKTEKAFLDDWFRTGDLGQLDHENYLTLTGLKKDMINIFGLKVYPKEVERILSYHPVIRSVRIRGEWHEKYGDIIACEVYTKPGQALSEKEFRQWCRQSISPYKIPRKIRIHS